MSKFSLTNWERRRLRVVMWFARQLGVPIDVRPEYFLKGYSKVTTGSVSGIHPGAFHDQAQG